MNFKTFSKYYTTLSTEISAHPNKDELLNIMSQQIEDDTPVCHSQIFKKRKAV
tara:strand:- start:139 stop:297 length:159 start_codon:yes stop_codon:yes gene_type:complete